MATSRKTSKTAPKATKKTAPKRKPRARSTVNLSLNLKQVPVSDFFALKDLLGAYASRSQLARKMLDDVNRQTRKMNLKVA